MTGDPQAAGKQPDWDALARELAGENPRPDDAVRAWLAAHPEEATRIHALEAAVRDLAQPAPHVDVDAALARVAARRDADNVVPMRRELRPFMRPAARRWQPALLAAAAVLVVVAGTMLWQHASSGRVETVSPRIRVTTTGVGKTESMRLADGSLVVLGPSSSFRATSDDPSRNPRDFRLRGVAYFEVTHDAAHPFTVRTGGAVVRDVGTRFTVDATPAAVEVAVTEGSVELATPAGQPVLLRAGDVGTGAADQPPRVRRNVVSPEVPAWTKGQLVFHDTPMSRVATELSRWYGITLVFADSSLRNRSLRVTLEHETPADAMRIIELALGVRIELRGDTAVVHAAPATRLPR